MGNVIPPDALEALLAENAADTDDEAGRAYRIVCLRQPGRIAAVAYAHERRRPGYWRKRLADVA